MSEIEESCLSAGLYQIHMCEHDNQSLNQYTSTRRGARKGGLCENAKIGIQLWNTNMSLREGLRVRVTITVTVTVLSTYLKTFGGESQGIRLSPWVKLLGNFLHPLHRSPPQKEGGPRGSHLLLNHSCQHQFCLLRPV